MPRESKADPKKCTAKIRKFHPLTPTTSLLLCLAAALGGCHAWSEVNHVCFSPNGHTVAFSLNQMAFVGFGYNLTAVGVGSIRDRVFWSHVDSPNRLHQLQVHSELLIARGGAGDGVSDLAFSPDSRHLAIRMQQKILIVEIATGKYWRLKPEDKDVDSMAWTSNDELTYCTMTVTGNSVPRVGHVRVYRHKIKDSEFARVEVYREDGKRASSRFFWSPAGRYAVLGPCTWGQCRLLEVSTGKVRNFGPENASLYESVSWKTDESAVFCVATRHRVLAEDLAAEAVGNEFFLIEPATGRITNWSKTYKKSGDVPHCHVARVWTADNQYVVGSIGGAGCSLIRPETREIIPLRDKINASLKISPPGAWPELHPLPVSGWLWTRPPPQIGVSKDRKSYAVDYYAREYIRIADELEWAVSPDGKRIAEVDKNGKVKIRELNLPAQPATQPAPSAKK